MPDLPHPPWLGLSAHVADRPRELALFAVPRTDSTRSASAERIPPGLHSVPYEHSRFQYQSNILPVEGGENDGPHQPRFAEAWPSRRRTFGPEPAHGYQKEEPRNLSRVLGAGAPGVRLGSGRYAGLGDYGPYAGFDNHGFHGPARYAGFGHSGATWNNYEVHQTV